MRTVRFNLVDVFTETPFTGNQLGVFTDARGLADEQMQMLAAELGFSECAFVLPPQGEGNARIRIFTPTGELPFAGHPVLGTAFVLGAPMQLVLMKLETGAGLVSVLLEREGARISFATMVQPLPRVETFDRPDEVCVALGIESSELPIELYDNGARHLFACVPTVDEVRALQPDLLGLRRLGDVGVSCFAERDGAVTTRMFYPAVGVAEDAATGSAAGPLAVHLARHGRVEWGTEVVISQGESIGRPSTLYARAQGDDSGPSVVEVGGAAVIVGKGEYLIR